MPDNQIIYSFISTIASLPGSFVLNYRELLPDWACFELVIAMLQSQIQLKCGFLEGRVRTSYEVL